jgi:hypothetical protein
MLLLLIQKLKKRKHQLKFTNNFDLFSNVSFIQNLSIFIKFLTNQIINSVLIKLEALLIKVLIDYLFISIYIYIYNKNKVNHFN